MPENSVVFDSFIDELQKLAEAKDVELNIFDKIKGYRNTNKQKKLMKAELGAAHKAYMKKNKTILSLEDFHTKIKDGSIPDALSPSFFKQNKRALIGAALVGGAYLALKPRTEEVEQPMV